jgi:hypothetical protein
MLGVAEALPHLMLLACRFDMHLFRADHRGLFNASWLTFWSNQIGVAGAVVPI